MKKQITVVCCYNDKKQFERLAQSLSRQTEKCALTGIDNCGRKFSSAAAALNSVIAEIGTEYVIFAHQDIELPEPEMLGTFFRFLKQLKTGDILGVAGAAVNPDRSARPEIVASYVRHGAHLDKAGEMEFSGMIPCDTVDECFFGGRTETFRLAPFDEALCDNWHLYAVERCLFARRNHRRVYVCALPLLHHSGGTINHAYNRNFYRIAKHYARKREESKGSKEMPWIRTVCGSSKTDFFHRVFFYWKRELLFLLHRL